MNMPVANLLSRDDQSLHPIQMAEQLSGIGKDLLRMWERRYGFPMPLRDARGDRVYTSEQIEKLRLLRQLIALGHRPGKIIERDLADLQQMLRLQRQHHAGLDAAVCEPLREALQAASPEPLQGLLGQLLVKQGLEVFLQRFMPDATLWLNESVADGSLAVEAQRRFEDETLALIRIAVSQLLPPNRPRKVMLATWPAGAIQLPMACTEGLLRLAGVDAVPASIPASGGLKALASAALKARCQAVLVHVGSGMPPTKAFEALEDLRFQLPLSVECWAVGPMFQATRRHIEAVRLFRDLPSVVSFAAA